MTDLNVEHTEYTASSPKKPFWLYLRILGFILFLSLVILVISVIKKVTITEALITNQTSNSATIVWTTDKSVLGRVEISESADFGTITKYYDDRDLEETGVGQYKLIEQTKRSIHHVTIRGLSPEKTYYYKITNNENPAEISNFSTPKVNDNIVAPDPVYGKVVNETEGVVMLKKISVSGESQLVSAVLSNGTYSLDAGNLLNRELTETYLKENYIHELWIFSNGATTKVQVESEKDQPVEDIKAGTDRLIPDFNIAIQAEQKYYSPNPAHQDNCCNIESRGCKTTDEWTKGWNECALDGKCGCVEKTQNNTTNNNDNNNTDNTTTNNGNNFEGQVEKYDEPCEKDGKKGVRHVTKVCGPDSTAAKGTGCTWGPGSNPGECIISGETDTNNSGGDNQQDDSNSTDTGNQNGCASDEVGFSTVITHQNYSTVGKYCGTNDKALYQCTGQCCKKVDACSNGCYFADTGKADRCCTAGESDTDTRCSVAGGVKKCKTLTICERYEGYNVDLKVGEEKEYSCSDGYKYKYKCAIDNQSPVLEQKTATSSGDAVVKDNIVQENSANDTQNNLYSSMKFKFKFNSFYISQCPTPEQDQSKAELLSNISISEEYDLNNIKNISNDGSFYKITLNGKTGWVKKQVFADQDIQKISNLNLSKTNPVDQCVSSNGWAIINLGLSSSQVSDANQNSSIKCPADQCYHKGEKRCQNTYGKGDPAYSVYRNPQNNKCISSYYSADADGICKDSDFYEIADDYCKNIPLLDTLIVCGADQCADYQRSVCENADQIGVPGSVKRHPQTNKCQGYYPLRNAKFGVCDGGSFYDVDEKYCSDVPKQVLEDCSAADKCRYSSNLVCDKAGEISYFIISDSGKCKKRERIKDVNDLCVDNLQDVDMSFCDDINTSVQTLAEPNLLDPGSYKVEGVNVTTKEFTISEPGKVVYFQDINGDGIKQESEPLYTGDVNSLNIQFNKVSEVQSYNMNYGWNLVSFPIYMRGDGTSNIVKASDLITQLNSGGINTTHVVAYRSGKFVTYSSRKDDTGNAVAFGEDFSILPGEGYFVRSYTTGIFIVKGKKIENGQQILMENGWNMVGIYNSGKLSYKGFEVLKQMNTAGVEADILSKWENGLYQNVVVEGGKEYGIDYGVYPYQGYFVRVKNRGAGVYTPQ